MSQESAKGRLVLTLRQRDKICIGPDVTVEFIVAKGQHVRLAFTAPKDQKIFRDKTKDEELKEGAE